MSADPHASASKLVYSSVRRESAFPPSRTGMRRELSAELGYHVAMATKKKAKSKASSGSSARAKSTSSAKRTKAAKPKARARKAPAAPAKARTKAVKPATKKAAQKKAAPKTAKLTTKAAMPATKAKPAPKAKGPIARRDATGHLDPKYARDLLSRSRGRDDGDRPFFLRPRSKDDLAEELGEGAVLAMTSGEDQSARFEAVVEEESGGPFVRSRGRIEFARGADKSNPRGATREPFPTALGSTDD